MTSKAWVVATVIVAFCALGLAGAATLRSELDFWARVETGGAVAAFVLSTLTSRKARVELRHERRVAKRLDEIRALGDTMHHHE